MATPPNFPQWLAREERKADRNGLQLSGIAISSKAIRQPVEVIDLSPLGCRLRVLEPMQVGSYITLESGRPSGVPTPPMEGWVAWSRPFECGIDFAQPMPAPIVAQIAARAAA
ncbi:PilZ domain-containing protein [Sphingomonas sp.]|jgi:hypothetical protein|uniref:PilZ domain-containing protein n=1 Tax=Sphingomonas sp. TaxID=28214 RepID=UPI002EDBB132